jgi:hypothetical protein
MSPPQKERTQPWKAWYTPIDKVATDLALSVMPIFLAGNGNNGTDHLDFAVFTGGSVSASAAKHAVKIEKQGKQGEPEK